MEEVEIDAASEKLSRYVFRDLAVLRLEAVTGCEYFLSPSKGLRDTKLGLANH